MKPGVVDADDHLAMCEDQGSREVRARAGTPRPRFGATGPRGGPGRRGAAQGSEPDPRTQGPRLGAACGPRSGAATYGPRSGVRPYGPGSGVGLGAAAQASRLAAAAQSSRLAAAAQGSRLGAVVQDPGPALQPKVHGWALWTGGVGRGELAGPCGRDADRRRPGPGVQGGSAGPLGRVGAGNRAGGLGSPCSRAAWCSPGVCRRVGWCWCCRTGWPRRRWCGTRGADAGGAARAGGRHGGAAGRGQPVDAAGRGRHRGPGKTGTTQDNADAWFAGFAPSLAAAVWVGYPQGRVPMVPPRTAAEVSGGTRRRPPGQVPARGPGRPPARALPAARHRPGRGRRGRGPGLPAQPVHARGRGRVGGVPAGVGADPDLPRAGGALAGWSRRWSARPSRRRPAGWRRPGCRWCSGCGSRRMPPPGRSWPRRRGAGPRWRRRHRSS